jgi:DNA polymerase family A
VSIKKVSLDFETFYDPPTGYTLKKMTGEEYIRSDLFEPLCIGVKFEGEKEYAVQQEDLPRFFDALRKHQDKLAVIHHHGQFDALISSHWFKFKPKLILCTLSMARASNFPRDMSLSLDSLSKHFNLLPKTVPYHLFQGKRWKCMDAYLKRQMLDGAARDALNAEEICNRLLPFFPREELISIDWTIKAYSEPQIIGYADEFDEIARNEERRKAELLRSLGMTKDLLTSNAKFAEILEALGVEVEMKANSKGQLIPAVAKSDSFMKELLEHEDETVKLLAETRLAVKSSIRETRAARMADMASRGMMTVYYYYCGAQNTTRHSGGDKFNWQNLERKGPIRKAIGAPAGKTLIIVDKSQIECRILNTASGQEDVVEMFRRGEDIYALNASRLYGFPVNKKDNPTERGTGKQIELSCGYGCGAPKFVSTAALGIYGPAVKLELMEGTQAVNLYRGSHPYVVEQWATGDWILDQWNKLGHAGTEYKLMGITYKDGYAILPSGLKLDYTTTTYDNKLRQYFFHHKKSFARNVSTTIPEGEAERWEWWYRRGYRTLYGAKMVEQLTQALSAVDYRQSCNRVYLKHGLRPAMSSHDEAVFVCAASEADYHAVMISREFSTPPKWLPNCPSACEIIIDERYSK